MSAIRSVFQHVVQDASGDVQTMPVYVFEADGTTLLGQAMYSALVGGTVLPNPLTPDNLGLVKAWTPLPQRVTVRVGSVTAAPFDSSFGPDEASLQTTNVRAFGPTLGPTDDWAPAVNAAIAALAPDGGTVTFPGGPGTVYRLGGAVSLASNVTLTAHGAVIRRTAGYSGALFAAASAVSNLRFEGLIVDQESRTGIGLACSLANGASRVTWQHCRFIGCSNARVIQANTGTAQNSHLTFRYSSIERTLGNQGAASENNGALYFYEPYQCRVEHSKFLGYGSVELLAINQTACGSASPSVGNRVQYNEFIGVQDTAVFVVAGYDNDGTYPDANCVMEDTRIVDNVYRDGGKWVEKGFCMVNPRHTSVMRGVKISRNSISNWGYNGASGGSAAPNTAQAIYVAGGSLTIMRNVQITDNIIDAAGSGGTPPSGSSQGIAVQAYVQNLDISANQVANTGHLGIAVPGRTGASPLAMERAQIVRNTLSGCFCVAPTAATTGAGISLTSYVNHCRISENTVANTGYAGAAEAAGIGVGYYEGGLLGAETLTNIQVERNCCYDDRSPKYQAYGIRVGTLSGSPTNAQLPSRITLRHNETYDNLTQGVLVVVPSVGKTQNVISEDNPGYGADGDLVLMTTTTGTIPFTIPIGTLANPFIGELVAYTYSGDNIGVAVYGVVRNSQGTPNQIVTAAPIWTRVIGTGVAPTIASTTPATGTFSVTNTMGGGTTYVYVHASVRGLG